MKKRNLLAIFMAFILIVVSACGNKNNAGGNGSEASGNDGNEVSQSEENVEFDFWHAMSGSNEEALTKIADDFMKENPNIKVNLINQGGYMDLFDKLMAAAKANQLPTMTQIYSNRLSWYISKDMVCDLTPYMNDEKIGFTKEEIDDIPTMFLDDGIWSEKQYAIPFNKSQMVLYYNEDMLKENGVEVPKTWEEWKEACKKLTKVNSNGDVEVYGCVFADNLSTDIAPWVVQSGGVTMEEDTNKVLFNSEPMKEAVTFLSSLFNEKVARFAGEDKNPNIPVQDGRAAMCVASTSALPYIEEGTKEGIHINAAALPGNKNDKQLYYGTNVAVFDSSTDAQKEAAWKFIKFLINTDNTAYFASQTGYIPVRESAKDTEVMKKVLEEKPIKRLPFECFDRGFQGTRNIGGKNALDELGKELELVFSGQKDIDSALKDAQENGQKALKNAQNN